MKLQKYAIFSNGQLQILLPLFVFVCFRFLFVLFSEPVITIDIILNQLLYPLCFDGLLYITALLILKPFLKLKAILIIITSYFILSNLVYFNHYRLYFTPPGTGAFAALFETTPQEAIEFTRLSNIWEVLGTFCISALPFIFALRLKQKVFKNKKFFFIASCLLIASSIIHLPYLKAPKDSLMPIDFSHFHRDFKNFYHYFDEYYTLIQLNDKRKNIKLNATQNAQLNKKKQAHILVIGESLSRNHMSLYGYQRKTTPKLDTSADIIFYKNVISPTTQTRSSIVRMLTPAFGVNTDRFYEEGSIITAMRESGFRTYWISNQGRYGISDTETSALADDADFSIFVNTDWNSKSLDEKVFSPLSEALSKNENKLFVTIHLLGSHFDYSKRVPSSDKFAIKDDFVKSELSSIEMKRVNEYDATVRYSDFIIDSLIQTIKNSSYEMSSLLYVSDHGEDVYDDASKMLGHGSPIVTRYTVEIPFLLWQSEKFMNQTIGEQTKNTSKFFNNGNLFHALIDLYDIEANVFEPQKSIFSEKHEEEYPYIINSNGFKVKYNKLINER